MTETERRKIEKNLIEELEDAVKNGRGGNDFNQKVLERMLAFQKQQEEIRNNLENQKIDLQKLEVEKKKIESQVDVAKLQRELEEQRLKQEKEIEERRLKAEKLTRMWNFIGTIVSVFGGLAGTIGGIVIGNKMFDKQATKAYKFEETGTISSFTSKQIMSGLKPPKR